ncbi:Probable Co/Zn/Cd efflux system membrane fusion protein [hydrothermal vent metagenome]|uniref:Probable Co/Zn/Cd efflux system membrane fusion protein n=1 Tax=hydrothermal vent metagenome TaxID=652676 RepID=A0A3B0SG82_9ZZZZ
MRLFPILAAIVVSALIYAFVFQRAALVAMFAAAPAKEVATPATDQTSPPEDAPKRVGVIAVHSTAQLVNNALILRGQTEADREVELRSETSGQVISEPLRKGAFVTEGQLLCRLDPAAREAALTEAQARLTEARARVPESQARVLEAQALLTEAEINVNAAEKLSTEGFASDTRVAATRAAVSSAEAAVQAARSGLEATQAGIQSAAAAVAAAEEEIKRLTITATFDGVLESDTAELGSLLQPGSLCATVIQLDPVILVGFVPETEVARVMLGAQAGARLASGDEVEGEVVFLSRSADPTTRTFRVEIEVPNPDLAIRDGQTAEILIAAEGVKAHLLPQSALTLNDEGTLGVRIVTAENKALFTPVTLLNDTTEGVWLNGLPEQVNVIIIGQEYVTDGVPVAASYEGIN